jgi:hypothetical protein
MGLPRFVGAGMSAPSIYAVVMEYAERLGIEFRPHDLRRTYGKLAHKGGAKGPYQGYNPFGQACIAALDDYTGMNPGTLLSERVSDIATNGVVTPVGELTSAVFLAPDSTYHLYYQMSLFKGSPDLNELLISILPQYTGFPFDVAIRTDSISPVFAASSFAVQAVSIDSAPAGPGLALVIEFAAPANQCDLATNTCATVGPPLSAGETSATFEISSAMFAGWQGGGAFFGAGTYTPLDGILHSFTAADSIESFTIDVPEPATLALLTLGGLICSGLGSRGKRWRGAKPTGGRMLYS